MLDGVRACARLSCLEAARSRLAWILGLYGAAAALALLATRDIAPEARSAAVASVLHGTTLVFGMLFVLAGVTRGIPGDLKSRLLYTVFTKPVRGGAYFAGRLLGGWCLAAAFLSAALLVGFAVLGTASASWGAMATHRVLAEEPRLRRGGNVVSLQWTPPAGFLKEVSCRVRFLNNPYDEPMLRVTWRCLPDGPEAAGSQKLAAGKRLVSFDLPPELAAGQRSGGLELRLEAPPEYPLAGLVGAEGHLLVCTQDARSLSWALLWAGDAALIGIELLLVATVAVCLSSFCSFPVALAAAAVFALAANAHAFLKMLPAALEPAAFAQTFVPTIYHVHRAHGDAYEPGMEETPSFSEKLLRVAQAVARRAIPVLKIAIPDMQALDSARRLGEGRLTPPREILCFAGKIAPYLLALGLLGVFALTQRSLP